MFWSLWLHLIWPLAKGSLKFGAGLALAAPHEEVYSGLWGYNSALSCIAIGGVFYGLTWQTHILSLICGKTENYVCYSSSEVENRIIKGVLMSFPALFCAYVTSATSKLMSVVSLKVSYFWKLIIDNVSCSPTSVPSPISSRYRPARGLFACRLSSSSYFPRRTRPSAGCPCPLSPTLSKTVTTWGN